MSHLVVCILHFASSQNVFSTNKWDSNARPETSVGDVVDPVLRLDEQVLQFFLGNVGFGEGLKHLRMAKAIVLRVLIQGRRLSGDLLKVLPIFSRVQRDWRTL